MTAPARGEPVRLDPPGPEPVGLGRFGEFGGRFVPETLVAPVEALERAYFAAREDEAFITELADRNLHQLWQQYLDGGVAGVPREELLGYLQEVAEVLEANRTTGRVAATGLRHERRRDDVDELDVGI